MVNKTLKAVVAASALIVAGSVYPAAGGDNTIVTQCIQGGQTVSADGQACTTTAGSQGTKSGVTGMLSRARGAVITFNNIANKTPIKLAQQGSIAVPKQGSAMKYAFGQMEIVVASFDLASTSGLPTKLAQIVAAAHKNNPEAKSMILVAVAKQGSTEFTEAIETYTDLEDLSKSEKIQYRATGADSLMVTLPASVDAPAQSLTLDLNPIKSDS